MILTTAPTALPPYKEEPAPLTTSILAIFSTGTISHSIPLLYVVFIGSPSNKTKISLELKPLI